MFDRLLLLPVRVMVDSAAWTTAGLWLAVVASGIYHGINPGMGWPLAVSAGLMGKGRGDLLRSLALLAVGHFFAMAGILLPFAAMTALVIWQCQIRVAAGLVVVTAGLYLLINRRHPRFLVRIRPSQLSLWSFAVATAHGAGLMLLPIYLGICHSEGSDRGHRAVAALIAGDIPIAIVVSIVHATAMIVSGGLIALAVRCWLGPQFIARSWFNVDVVWALSLVTVGAIGAATALLTTIV